MKNRAFLRLRDRNQITLPADVVTRFGLEPGDFLEIVLSGENGVQLRPAQIVSAGTAEAELREKESAERMGRRENRMYSPEEFRRHVEGLGQAEVIEDAPKELPAESEAAGAAHKPRMRPAVKAALARERMTRSNG